MNAVLEVEVEHHLKEETSKGSANRRKVTKTKGAWSNDKGLLKQLYLALKHNEKS